MENLSERIEKMTPLQRAVFALKETRARLDALEQKRSEPIAIVGMACRFPGRANDPAGYWRLLCEGTNAITEIPADRWDAEAFYDPDPAAPGKMNTKWGGFLDRVDEFDNHFFGISEREAEEIDPQHRLVLELAWEALEDAGLPPSRLRGSRTGVFIGLSHSEYGIMLSTDLSQTDAFVATGTAHCIAANRVSFLFDLLGPSVTLDTACSSSLVTVHMACQSIRNGESDMALAGGVNVILSPLATVNLTKAGFSAPDGRIRAFDAEAAGYVRGEGAGLVVLKPLAAALADNDPIYAVIRGSAVNQNGWSNGLTAPSRKAQERALREAYRQANVSPGKIQYVETQGTGTLLGDAIEASALGSVLAEGRPGGDRCAIGSVKTNIGHLEAASGVASLMKVALALRHQQLPASLNFKTPNPDVGFDKLPLKVQQQLEPWPAADTNRVAGVSAFGFGGSNAHMVLTEAPVEDHPITTQSASMCLLPLSARTEGALRDHVRGFCDHLRDDELPPWTDVCYTAALRRDHHDCRLAVQAATPEQAAQVLESVSQNEMPSAAVSGRKPFGRELKLACIYDSWNPEWASGMGAMAAQVPHLNESLVEVAAELSEIAKLASPVVLDDPRTWEDTKLVPAATVALQIAWTCWWRYAGANPQIVLGRGIGELTAAWAAGILNDRQALQMALALGRGENPGSIASGKTQPAKLPYLSAWDGRAHDGHDLDPARWNRCTTDCDGLDQAIRSLGDRQVDVCLQIGLDTLGTSLALDATSEASSRAVASCMTGADGQGGWLDAIARLYAAGVDFAWPRVLPIEGRCVRLPTYPWQRHRVWAERKDWLAGAPPAAAEPTIESDTADDSPMGADTPLAASIDSESRPIVPRPDLNTPYVAPRTELEEGMARSWSGILRVERVGVHDNFFELGGDSLQAMILHNDLQDQLGEVVLGYVLFQAQTIDELAAYLRRSYRGAIRRKFPTEEVEEGDEPLEPTAASVGESEVGMVRRLIDQFAPLPSFPAAGSKNPRAVFVVAPPRSGTTLLRVMLAGHDRLFAPPELEMLGFATMADRHAAYADEPVQWLEGVVRTVMEVRRCDVDQARRIVQESERSGMSVQDFYRALQEPLEGRLLVDKTPSYSGRLEIVQRVEQLFEDPLYIHLVRHPCGMIRSYVDYRMHEEFTMRLGGAVDIPFTPQQMGELTWVVSHQNILQMLENVPAERWHRMQFEEMVRQPEQTMRSLCSFLGMDFAEEMIHPYENRERKMLDGVVAEDRMYGDQKFIVKHKTIDPSVADAWQREMTSEFLGPLSRTLAGEFGYDDVAFPQRGAAGEQVPLAGEAVSFASLAPQDANAEDLLQRLDGLSDEEVSALLREHMTDEST